MKTRLLLSVIVLTTGLSAAAIAQAPQQDHQQHHPPESPQTQAAPPTPPAAPPAPPSAATPGQGQMPMGQMPMGQMPMGQMPMGQMPMGQMPMTQMMQGMPEQCRAMMQTMMQNMPENCMSMMRQMMQGRMGMTPGGMQAQAASQSAATKAYMEAADRMHGPMMEGLQASDPDVAFVRSMIAHHQGAIDMAKVALQYGKDDQTKKWASDVIREQQREINEMEEWLKKNAR